MACMLFFKIILKKNQFQYTKNKMLESKLANSAKKKKKKIMSLTP